MVSLLMSSFSCFETTRALQEAVDLFLMDPNNATQTYGDMRDWCTRNIVDLGRLFSTERNPRAANFTNSVGNWDTSNAQSLALTFEGAAAFDGDLANWNVSRVTDLRGTFRGASSFTGRGLETWDVSRVESLEAAFDGARSLQGEALAAWRFSPFTLVNLNRAFAGCTSFDADVGLWDVSGVTNFNDAFANCTSFRGDGLEQWDTSKAIGMERIFQNCTAMNVDLAGWNLTNILTMNRMLEGASSFAQDLCPWQPYLRDAIVVPVDTEGMFEGTACPITEVWPNATGPMCFLCGDGTDGSATSTVPTQSPTLLPIRTSQPSTAQPSPLYESRVPTGTTSTAVMFGDTDDCTFTTILVCLVWYLRSNLF